MRDNKFTPSENIYTRATIALAGCAILVNLGFGLGLPFLPFFMEELPGGSRFLYAFVLVAFQSSRALFSGFFGAQSDILGRRPIMLGGLLFFSFSSLLFVFLVDSPYFLIIAGALLGTAGAAVWPVAEASLIDHISPKKRGEGLSLYLTASNAGFLVGPGVGGTLQSFALNTLKTDKIMSYRVPYLFSFALALGAAILLYFLVSETVSKNPGSSILTTDTSRVNENGKLEKDDWSWDPVNLRSVRVLYVTSWANGVSIGLITSIFAYFLADLYGANPFEIGLVMAISGVSGLGANLVAGRVADRVGRKPLVITGQTASRGGTFFFPFGPDLISATFLNTFRVLGLNVAMPAGRALQADLIPAPVRGAYFGRLQAAFNVGMVIGPIGGAYLYELYYVSTIGIGVGGITFPGFAVPFWFSVFVGVFSLVLFIFFVTEPGRE